MKIIRNIVIFVIAICFVGWSITGDLDKGFSLVGFIWLILTLGALGISAVGIICILLGSIKEKEEDKEIGETISAIIVYAIIFLVGIFMLKMVF